MRTKYVRILRNGECEKSYTSLKAAEHMVAADKAISYASVTLKQIKEEQLYHYREDDYFQQVAIEAFHKEYNGKRFKAKVVNGGARTKMLVKILGADDLGLRTIYACNIKGAKTWYPETACTYYETDQEIEVELKVFSNFSLLIIGLTPGLLDEAHWNRIKTHHSSSEASLETGKANTGCS